MAMVGLAICLGGGGTVNPQNEMMLQFLTALIMIPLVVSSNWQRGLGAIPGAAWLLGFLVLLLPILHLIPLLPSLWHGLPGRAVEVQSLAVVQAEHMWMPLSMAPARTFASLLAATFAVLLMLQVSRLSVRGRNWLCSTIVAGGLLSLVLGVLQLSHTGGWDWSLYAFFSKGFLVGFYANRNAEVDFLLIALLALGVLATVRLADGRNHVLTWFGLVIGIVAFVVGIFMTGSRTGISILMPALLILAVMVWPVVKNRKRALRWIGGLSAAFVLTAVLLLQLPSVQKVIGRFYLTTDARWDLWADTWYSMGQVWPFGSGIGTIVPMLEAAERLDVVDPGRPVRAHNDWLEWSMETGLPGLVVLGLIIVVVGIVAARALAGANRSGLGPGRRAQVIFACGVMLITALHSIVDYPLRSMSLAALIAVAAAFLLEPAAAQQNRQ
jgi:O-antigen ligase